MNPTTPDLAIGRKAFATLAACAALKGYQLWRTEPADGVQRFIVARFGLVQVLADLNEVERFLERAGA